MTAPVDQVSVAIVPDFGRFPAEMRRGVDQAMRELAARVDAAMTGVEGDFREAATTLGRDMQVGGEVAEQAFRELNHVATAELASVDTKAAASAGLLGARFKAAGAVAVTAMLGAGIAVGAGLALLTGMGLKSAAAMEQTQIAFNSLLGSVEVGTKVFKDLQQFAAVTPFQFSEITPVAQRFFTFADVLGMAKTDVKEFLTTLGDLASVTGSGAFGMERAALAMSQMAAKGRLSAQDVNQLADAFPGFNVRAAIASQLGLTVAETMQRMENGTIDAQTGLRALIEGMKNFPGAAGAMEKQAFTLMGVFSTFKDTFAIALVDAFTPVIPSIKQTLTDITPILGDATKQLAPLLGDALTALLKIAGPLVKGLSSALAPLVAGLGDAFNRLADSGALEQVGVALGELSVSLAPALPLLGEFLAAALEIAVPVLLLLAAVLRPLTPLLNGMTRAIEEFARAMGMIDWAAVGKAIGGFFADLWGSISGFFSDVAEGAAALPEAIRLAFQGMVNIGAAKMKELIGLVIGLPKRILDALVGLGGLLVDTGKNMVLGLWRGISGLAGWLYNQVKRFAIDNTIGAIKDALGIHSESQAMRMEVGRWIPPGISAGVRDATPGLRDVLHGLSGSVVNSASPVAAASGLGGISFGAGAVVVQFNGAVPTPAQAHATGIQVGQGIIEAINRRNVTTAVRQRA